MSQLNFVSTVVHNMNLHVLPTDKFKTTTIIVHIEQELAEETVTKTAMIPYILKRGCEKYPTTQQLRQYLDGLFGAVFHTDVIKKGETQIIQLQIEIANEKYLSDPAPLLKKGIEFLGEVITRPLVENGGFSESFVKSEAEILKKKISSLVDDKIRYANQRVTEEMCKNEPYRLLAYGTIDDLNRVNASDLYTYYKKLLAENPIDIYVIGDLDVQEVKEIVSKSWKLERGSVKTIPFAPKQKNNVKEQTVIDTLPVGQGKLNIGCRTHTTLADDDYEALLVCNGILGGFPHSKLFVNVRERASLAYYAVSRLESHKGILMMMSGIEIANFEQAVEIMKQQLNAMKQGEISDKEMSQTIATLSNQLIETMDNPRTIVDFAYSGRLAGRNRTIEEMLSKIRQISKEDVSRVARKIDIDTVYFLRDKEGR